MFASVADAVAETGATASMVIVPAPGAPDAVLEAAEAGVELIVVVTEGIPMHDEARFYNQLQRDFPTSRILGPNCPGSHARASATSASSRPRSRRRAARSASSAARARSPTRR